MALGLCRSGTDSGAVGSGGGKRQRRRQKLGGSGSQGSLIAATGPGLKGRRVVAPRAVSTWAGLRAPPRAWVAVSRAAGVGTCHSPRAAPRPCATPRGSSELSELLRVRVPGAAPGTAGPGAGVAAVGGQWWGAGWDCGSPPCPDAGSSCVPGDPARAFAESSGRGNELFCKWMLREGAATVSLESG